MRLIEIKSNLKLNGYKLKNKISITQKISKSSNQKIQKPPTTSISLNEQFIMNLLLNFKTKRAKIEHLRAYLDTKFNATIVHYIYNAIKQAKLATACVNDSIQLLKKLIPEQYHDCLPFVIHLINLEDDLSIDDCETQALLRIKQSVKFDHDYL